ncbi:glycosyltransferase [Desulfovibrio aminophilus]|nr:glycosyltransferase [Desulfovibrio aminophilus]MCM0756595.1 glycosyltransferase [Desulfovibrio aminophilus]
MKGRVETVVCLGGIFFSPALAELGFEVRHLPLARGEILDWDAVCRRAGLEPDLLLYLDRSTAPPLVGLESLPCLTAFWCIDSHIHSWYPTWAQGFDLCFVSLRDHLPLFRGRLSPERVIWLPPFADHCHRPPDSPVEPEWDLLFAGTVDPETTPGRAAFLAELGRRLPGLAARRGVFSGLYPRARLGLNIAERGDLNFRVMEALACGACLLTPRVGHGQDELFRDGEHLFIYDPKDMDGLVRLVEELLAEPERAARVAEAGRLAVEAAHRPIHRARTVAQTVRGLDAAAVVAERLAHARDIRERYLKLVYLHWAEAAGNPAARAAYLTAAKR